MSRFAQAMATPCRAPALLVSSMLLSLAIPSSVAHTCDPGPIYVVTIERSDAPDCMTITPRRRVSIGPFGSKPDPSRVASVEIENGCSEPIDLEVIECTACGEGKRILAGSTSELVLENRPQSDAIDYDKHTRQVWRWRMGAKAGSVASDVTVHDDTEACRGAIERAGDSVLSGCSN